MEFAERFLFDGIECKGRNMPPGERIEVSRKIVSDTAASRRIVLDDAAMRAQKAADGMLPVVFRYERFPKQRGMEFSLRGGKARGLRFPSGTSFGDERFGGHQ
jgi:hypothetical protein